MAARRTQRRRRGEGRSRRAPPDIERILDRGQWPLDFYHHLLVMPWWGLFLLLAASYLVFNLVFATLYWLQGDSIANARAGSFTDAFFFSVQTMATIGYGAMSPATVYANVLVTIEVLLGMTGLAVASGLVFARFSRPTAQVMFSRVAVITSYDGVPSLVFRAANQRRNQILEAQVSVMVLRDEVSEEGLAMRRFHDLRVLRPHTPMFALSWTVIHPIDEESPLFGESRESLARSHSEIVVTIVGVDETFAQTVYARHSYEANELHWNHRFADILTRSEDGRRVIDYRRFHDTIEVPAARRQAKV
jgi:inward rectifier potassium channel